MEAEFFSKMLKKKSKIEYVGRFKFRPLKNIAEKGNFQISNIYRVIAISQYFFLFMHVYFYNIKANYL